MKLTNKLLIISAMALSMSLAGCDNTKKTNEVVVNSFIEENKYMTERDALSREINYYRPPKIVCNKTLCKLSGRDLIHIANEIEKDNEHAGDPIVVNGKSIKPFCYMTIEVGSVKSVGMDNPDKYVGTLYLLGGDFVHYANGATRKYRFGIYIPSIGRYLEASFRNLPIELQNSLKTSEGEWVQHIPTYDDIALW